jgi:hypothetical protein
MAAVLRVPKPADESFDADVTEKVDDTNDEFELTWGHRGDPCLTLPIPFKSAKFLEEAALVVGVDPNPGVAASKVAYRAMDIESPLVTPRRKFKPTVLALDPHRYLSS